MERDLTINFLKKPRDSARWKFSPRYLFYGVILSCLLPMYFKSALVKKSKVQSGVNAAIASPENSIQLQNKAQWAFVTHFFNALNTNLPTEANIDIISFEQNQITLDGKINNNVALDNFIALLSKKMPSSIVSLIELSQKTNLEFSILIKSKQNFSLLSENNEASPTNDLIQNIAHSAQNSFLQIDTIKPENNEINWQFEGSYAALMHFFGHLKKTNLALDNFEIKPDKNQLEFTAQLRVIQI